MTTLFKTPEARERMLAWHARFRAELPAPTESRHVPTRFGEAHVLVAGPPDGPPVVALHGAMASSAHVLRELGPLLATHRLYAVDIAGQSPCGAEARLSVANNDYGHWLADVLDGLGLTTTAILGVSWGAFVALRLAAVAPDRIARLGLLVPAGMVSGPVFKGLTRVGLPMMHYMMRPSPERLKAALRHLVTSDDPMWEGYLGEAFLAYKPGMQVPHKARDGEFSGLQAPVYVVGAALDLSFPGEAVVARARQIFPNLAGEHVLPDSAHCPPTTPEFRAGLCGRLGPFLAGEA